MLKIGRWIRFLYMTAFALVFEHFLLLLCRKIN